MIAIKYLGVFFNLPGLSNITCTSKLPRLNCDKRNLACVVSPQFAQADLQVHLLCPSYCNMLQISKFMYYEDPVLHKQEYALL